MRPKPNIHCPYEISGSLVGTADTGEAILGGTITTVNLRAPGAFLARIPWINHNHGQSGQAGLVADILPELEEPPIAESFPLRLVGLKPACDTGEILQSYRCTGALRRLDDSFADGVISIGLKTGLLASQLAQLPPCCATLQSLQLLATLGKALTLRLNFRATIDCAIGIDCQVDHPQVDPQHASIPISSGAGTSQTTAR